MGQSSGAYGVWFKTRLHEKGGYLCTNNSIRSLLMVLKEIMDHISQKESVELDTLAAEDLLPLVKEYSTPLAEAFALLSTAEIENFRSRQALKGVRANALRMMSLVHASVPSFEPAVLAEYLDTIDEEGTEEARQIIEGIVQFLFEHVIGELKKKYPVGDDWWYEGVPDKIRNACVQKAEAEKGKKNREQYLYLIGYRDIAHKNWDIFQKLFSLGEHGNRVKVTNWLVELNAVRNTTHLQPRPCAETTTPPGTGPRHCQPCL